MSIVYLQYFRRTGGLEMIIVYLQYFRRTGGYEPSVRAVFFLYEKALCYVQRAFLLVHVKQACYLVVCFFNYLIYFIYR